MRIEKRKSDQNRRKKNSIYLKGGSQSKNYNYEQAFLEFMARSPPLITFVAREGCPACSLFQSEWEKLVSDAQFAQTFAFNKLSTYSIHDYVPYMEVQGYPTIILNHPSTVGKVIYQGGARTKAEDIKTWAVENISQKNKDN